MAPSPENDNTPKAPDKTKSAEDEIVINTSQTPRNSQTENKHASVSKLNDGELKALLDEAMEYKNPKDREGKSALFKDLLKEAEENERNARAASAGGSELVRYYNSSARRHARHNREVKSVSENLTHGGSLNNLAKEELYESVGHHRRPKKTVSARAKEGGSLPCNVNVGVSWENRSFVEDKGKKCPSQKRDTVIDMEAQSLLENDCLDQNYGGEKEKDMGQGQGATGTYTATATMTISNVEEVVKISQLEPVDKIKETMTLDHLHTNITPNNCSVVMSSNHFFQARQDRKVDENANALGQNVSDTKKNKKKKIQTEKNVVVTEAKDLAGHRGDIIDDLEQLLNYIEDKTVVKSKNNVHKTKLHKQQAAASNSGDEKSGKKQRARTKGKTANADTLKKSNSLDEMSSTAKLNELDNQQSLESKVPLRATKSGADRTRERRSWGNTEQLQFQLYPNVSVENLETAEFCVVTKKKKSKKRHNSLSGPNSRQQYSRASNSSDFNRVPSPELRRNQPFSVPHSEKSNDSSDADSVHSLPIDTDRIKENLPVSYADIAKNSNSLERPKWNRPPSERKQTFDKSPNQEKSTQNQEKPVVNQEKPLEIQEKPAKIKPPLVTQGVQTSPPRLHEASQRSTDTSPRSHEAPQRLSETPPRLHEGPARSQEVTPRSHADKSPTSVPVKISPPDVHNIDNFPSIQCKTLPKNSVVVQNSLPAAAKPTLKSGGQNNVKNNNLKSAQVIAQTAPVCSAAGVKPSKGIAQLGINAQEIVDDHLCLQNIQGNIQPMPHNIQDVQTIEKMHFAQANSNSDGDRHHSVDFDCDNVDRTSDYSDTPPVVILSGDGNKEVSGLVFGFEINEKLLSDDVCNSFISRFIMPVKYNTSAYNHDKIVNFVGQAWDDIVNQSNGKIQYYSEENS